MSSFVRAESSLEKPPVAVLLPGAGYTVMGPLLYWCAELLAQAGWHVQGVEWKLDDHALNDPHAFVENAVANAFADAPTSSRRLIVAKSFGCFALPWARSNDIPGIWMTPVLTDERVFRALIEASPADLTIDGGADPVWMPEAIAATRATVLSVPNANHSLTIPGDWRASLEAQQTVFESIAEHIERR